jgi:DNA-binding ferritin-like protein (Dps family)
MTMFNSGFISKMVGEKRRWRQYKARTKQLPASYRTAAEALERYLMCFGPGDGTSAATMFEDLAELFEQSAANGTPIRAILGENPAEFAETFLANYPEGGWITKERTRLSTAVALAAGEGTTNEGTPR